GEELDLVLDDDTGELADLLPLGIARTPPVQPPEALHQALLEHLVPVPVGGGVRSLDLVQDGTHLAALQHWVLDPPEEVVDRLLEELIVHPQGVVRVQDQRLAAAHIVRHLRYRTGHRRRTHPRFRRPGSPRRSTGARSAARRASAFRRRTYS